MNSKNVALLNRLVALLKHQQAKLFSDSSISSMGFIKLVRSMMDLKNDQHSNLVKSQAELVSFIWDGRKESLAEFGRETARLLIACPHPAVKKIWTQILAVNSPNKSTANIEAIMYNKTPRRNVLLLLTPEQESKLYFLLTEVSKLNVKRYLSWFAEAYVPFCLK